MKADRDLKPANVLLLSDCQLRITDFGLSRRIKTKTPPPEEEKPTKNDAADDEVNLTGCTCAQQLHGKGLLCQNRAAHFFPQEKSWFDEGSAHPGPGFGDGMSGYPDVVCGPVEVAIHIR